MNFNRTIVISDIHGCYGQFTALLERVDYNAMKDKLILLGDYVSRGPCSKDVVELVMLLVEQHGAIALKGNHDYRFVRVMENIASGKEITAFFENGGVQTLTSYLNGNKIISKDNIQHIREDIRQYWSHINFLKSLPAYYEDESFIYVHAGINPNCRKLSDQNIQDLLYIKEEFYNSRTNQEKIIIFGHTITQHIHGTSDIWFGGDKIGIDGGCTFGYQLNALELKEGKVNAMYHVKA